MRAAVLYGSAARGDWVPGRSDVNLLLLVDDTTPTALRRLTPAVTEWHTKGFAPPLIMGRDEWLRSVDVFPIEITDMQLSHRILCGPDPIAGMTVEPGDLREAVEKELRGKLVRLRQAYVRFGDAGAILAGFALASISTYFALLRCLAVLSRRAPGNTPAETAAALKAELGADAAIAVEIAGHRAQARLELLTRHLCPVSGTGAANGRAGRQLSTWESLMRRSRFSLLFLLGIVGLSNACSYNRLQTLDEQINAAQGQIKVQLQRRADLIGNLVATVKGVTKQEDSVFIGIAEARAKLAGAAAGTDVQAMAQANADMKAPLGRLLALTENYPNLRSADNFKALQDEIAGTENRIAVARTDYNGAVKDFNTKIRQFPTNLTAKMFGLGKERPYFDVTSADAANAPVVKF